MNDRGFVIMIMIYSRYRARNRTAITLEYTVKMAKKRTLLIHLNQFENEVELLSSDSTFNLLSHVVVTYL